MLMLIRITSTYFCAGFDTKTKQIAPIIVYMKNWPVSRIRDYCFKKKWKFQIIVEGEEL